MGGGGDGGYVFNRYAMVFLAQKPVPVAEYRGERGEQPFAVSEFLDLC